MDKSENPKNNDSTKTNDSSLNKNVFWEEKAANMTRCNGLWKEVQAQARKYHSTDNNDNNNNKNNNKNDQIFLALSTMHSACVLSQRRPDTRTCLPSFTSADAQGIRSFRRLMNSVNQCLFSDPHVRTAFREHMQDIRYVHANLHHILGRYMRIVEESKNDPSMTPPAANDPPSSNQVRKAEGRCEPEMQDLGKCLEAIRSNDPQNGSGPEPLTVKVSSSATTADAAQGRCFVPYYRYMLCMGSHLCARPINQCISQHTPPHINNGGNKNSNSEEETASQAAIFDLCFDNDVKVARCKANIY